MSKMNVMLIALRPNLPAASGVIFAARLFRCLLPAL